MIILTIDHPDSPERRVFRESVVTIGRSRQCDLCLPHAKGVSRFHCRLVVEGEACFLEDLGSRNHSLVNGQAVSRCPVKPGDQLVLGTTRLELESLRSDEPTEEFLQPCFHCGHLFPRRRSACPACGTEARLRSHSRAIGANTFTGYRLIRRLGSGGMGIVFEAEELGRRESRHVALKVLRPHLAGNAAYLARFIEELRVLTCLRHPAIVSVYGRGREEGLQYLVMELVRGQSARMAMLKTGFLPWQAATNIVWQAAKALNAAHQQAGIVHGDVKPGNFLLDEAGHVKLCDFGLAHVDLKRRGESRDGAVEAERRGTAAYAAPERFLGQGGSSVQGDIYSLGISLFQLAAGQLPYRGGSVKGFREQHLKGVVPSLLAIRPDINPALQFVVERMLARHCKDRYPDYPSLIDDLGFILP